MFEKRDPLVFSILVHGVVLCVRAVRLGPRRLQGYYYHGLGYKTHPNVYEELFCTGAYSVLEYCTRRIPRSAEGLFVKRGRDIKTVACL